MLLCAGKPIPAKAGTGGVRSGNESIEGLNFGANAELHPDIHTLRAPKFPGSADRTSHFFICPAKRG